MIQSAVIRDSDLAALSESLSALSIERGYEYYPWVSSDEIYNSVSFLMGVRATLTDSEGMDEAITQLRQFAALLERLPISIQEQMHSKAKALRVVFESDAP